jgi:hypothetical protein
MKTNEFKKRVINVNYASNYITRDYEKSNETQQKQLLKYIKQIYTNCDDLKVILQILGSALTGKATKDQKILFLLGQGSSGKSTILELTNMALECYFISLESEAFSKNNKNKDKTFSTFYGKPHIRVIWTNEPCSDRTDAELFKCMAEGKLQGKLLYRDGIHKFNHNALPIFTANTMPNIIIDSGVKRRMRGYIHTSEFVEDKNKIDETTHIYYKNRSLLEDINNHNLLDAWIDILCESAQGWINGKIIEETPNFTKATSEMICVNDNFMDFIEVKVIITNDENDKIGKDEMMNMYKSMYPQRHLSFQQLISRLKDKKIEYDCQKRRNGIKGVFIGVKINEEDLEDIEDKVSNIFDDENEDPINIENDKLKKENNELKNLIDLQKQESKKENDELKKLIDLQKQELENLKLLLQGVDIKKDESKVEEEFTTEPIQFQTSQASSDTGLVKRIQKKIKKTKPIIESDIEEVPKTRKQRIYSNEMNKSQENKIIQGKNKIRELKKKNGYDSADDCDFN